MIREIGFEEMQSLNGLENKRYSQKTSTDVLGFPIGIRFLCRGNLNSDSFGSEKVISLDDRADCHYTLDREGLPCMDGFIGPIGFREYDMSFLKNGSFAEAMGGRHQRVIKEIRPLVEERKDVYEQYLKYLEEMRGKVDNFRQVRLKSKYMKEIYKVYSPRDERVLDIISSSKKWPLISIDDDATFGIWYTSFLKERGYELKAGRTDMIIERKALWLWGYIIRKEIEKNGFVRTDNA